MIITLFESYLFFMSCSFCIIHEISFLFAFIIHEKEIERIICSYFLFCNIKSVPHLRLSKDIANQYVKWGDWIIFY